jgi:formate dehydrogenase subunit gamma
MFAVTFEKLNALGVPALLGMEPFPTVLTPHAEMQYAQLWHAIVAFGMMAIILAHIYLGSVGMEGAFDAMGSGQVEKQWAKEHHGLWVEELEEKGQLHTTSSAKATPAE